VTSPAGAPSLAAAAALGPFFEVTDVPGPGWVTWAELVDGDPLWQRVAYVASTLAAGPGTPDVDGRIAASLTHLGLAARLLSPVLGAALLGGVLPVAEPREVHLQLSGANPLPLAMPTARSVRVADAGELAGALDREWLVPAVQALSVQVTAHTGLSVQVLTGNTVSAVAGALRMAAAAAPELTAVAAATLDAVLAGGSLAGTGRRRDDGGFVRGSCCLLYRLPGAGTCGDCILG
jgi:hypothetical protein